MKSESVSEICSSILTGLGFGGETLMSLMRKWSFFVEECEEGYGWDYSEYKNEIGVRRLIQRLLEDPRVSSAEELKDLFSELVLLDEKFRSLLRSDVLVAEGDAWWEKGVLIRAGDEYCHYMKCAHGVSVENVEG
ncbi:hypothetical protein [Pseudomonas corrugata]|uniref:hypothetical protein n=1 Tax=Pseudomonas corrugata TaxID=47879 RepID=UPI0015864390|nr:hypothetical protein [Pseudomonas corrugata]MCI0993868.1 hypothetical protein [Pseudomonas corrugata]NUT67228.1 hypothetical protein [Pseudomonas corrugata]